MAAEMGVRMGGHKKAQKQAALLARCLFFRRSAKRVGGSGRSGGGFFCPRNARKVRGNGEIPRIAELYSASMGAA